MVEAIGCLGSQLAGRPRAAFVLFDWLARIMPGNLIMLVINTMVSAITLECISNHLGGDNQESELRTPPLSPLTWVQWRYNWEAQAGEHTFKVRAYDGSGELQKTDMAPPHPNGATGI